MPPGIRMLAAAGCSIAIATAIWACGSSSSPSPSPSTPPPTASVTTVTISGSAPAVGASAQLTATAALSDGSTRIVTQLSAWQSSNTSVATVLSSGVVTGVGAGVADITATYQSVSGISHLTLVRPAPTTYTVSGRVTDGTSGGVLPGIHVQVSDGADAGESATTDGGGEYAIGGLSAGSMTIAASAASYQTVSKSVAVNADTRLDFVLPRLAPPPAPVCEYFGTDGSISRNLVVGNPTVLTSLPTCSWTATSNDAWLQICESNNNSAFPCSTPVSSLTRTGGLWMIPVSVADGLTPNPGPGRVGTITVRFSSGQITLSVRQAGCFGQPFPC